MELVFAALICLSILNILPWIFLMIRRPDEEVIEIIAESDEALAKIVQFLAQKIDSIEELALDVANPAQNFDLGSMIGQIITRNLNSQNSQNI